VEKIVMLWLVASFFHQEVENYFLFRVNASGWVGAMWKKECVINKIECELLLLQFIVTNAKYMNCKLFTGFTSDTEQL
jgi:hypothetical protein